jgi:hypothetical protein
VFSQYLNLVEFNELVEFVCCFFNGDDYINAAKEKNQGKDAETNNYLLLH